MGAKKITVRNVPEGPRRNGLGSGKKRELKFEVLSLKRVKAEFPGALTEDKLELHEPTGEKNYHRFVVRDGRLFSCCYEVFYYSWEVWLPREKTWADLDGVNMRLFDKFDKADVLIFEKPQKRAS